MPKIHKEIKNENEILRKERIFIVVVILVLACVMSYISLSSIGL